MGRENWSTDWHKPTNCCFFFYEIGGTLFRLFRSVTLSIARIQHYRSFYGGPNQSTWIKCSTRLSRHLYQHTPKFLKVISKGSGFDAIVKFLHFIVIQQFSASPLLSFTLCFFARLLLSYLVLFYSYYIPSTSSFTYSRSF